ncbi:MAG: SDR family oxidoreductase [Saprospiraceae bacterium]|nr:SDR family oxidoreductase [Saprospiraceae bacterium]
MSFQNKVVWITGASSGIGEHLAYAFATQGARLILSSRNEAELERVKKRCTAAAQVLLLPLDVAQFGTIPEAVQKATAQFGQIDVLVNNAGISQRALAADSAFEVDQRIMDVNFLGTVAMTKAVLPLMLARRSGQIVVISSVMGKVGFPGRSAYAASKHALHGFFDTLRAEVFRHNIKVTILCPGYVQTNVTVNALKGDGSKNNVMAEETRNGIPADVFAAKALRIIAAEKEEALIGGKELLGVYLKRFIPGVLSRIIRKREVG